MYYENLPRFCPHCKVVGHSEEGCNVKKIKAKNNKTEIAKAAETLNAAELEAGPIVAATGSQVDSSVAEKSKVAQTEWVTKLPKTTRGQSVGRSTSITVNPDSGNKFKVLDGISETDEEQSQAPETSSTQIRVTPKQQQVQMGGTVYIQQANQIASGELKRMQPWLTADGL